MDKYINRYGRSLPEATRLALPEMSYAQELLNVPVPFENRVLFLSEYSKANSVPATNSSIAKQLNITDRQAKILIETVEPPLTGRVISDEIEYVADTTEVIEEELSWMLEYEQLELYLSAKSVGTHLRKKPDWVLHRTNEFGIYPKKMIMPSKRTAMGFEKTIVLPLRHWILHHPPAGDWLSQKNLMEELGRHQDWVKPRLEDLGFEPKSRIAHGHNTPADHYPPHVLKELREYIENQPKPAGEWLTVGSMASILKRDRKWILKRIVPYRTLAESRLDDFGREAVHYPPSVLDALTLLDEQD